MNTKESPRTDEARETAKEARETVQEAREELRQDAAEVQKDITASVESVAAQQKNVFADELDNFSQAVLRAAEEFQKHHRPTVANYTSEFGNAMHNFASSLRQQDLRDSMVSLHHTARSYPLAFMGGAMLAGMALGRLVRLAASDPAGPGPHRHTTMEPRSTAETRSASPLGAAASPEDTGKGGDQSK